MKKLLLLTLSLFCLELSAQTKNFKVDTNKVGLSFVVDPNKNDHEVKVKVKNISTQKLDLMWTREALMMPENSSSFICDANLCYAPFTSNCPFDSPNELNPGASFDLKLTYIDNGTADPAHIVIWVYEKEDTASKLKVDFLFNKTIASSKTVADVSKIKLYPNPANTAFSLQNANGVTYVELFSLLGRKVMAYNMNGGRSIDISNLSEGVYIVKMFNSSKQVVKTVRLQKRFERA